MQSELKFFLVICARRRDDDLARCDDQCALCRCGTVEHRLNHLLMLAYYMPPYV